MQAFGKQLSDLEIAAVVSGWANRIGAPLSRSVATITRRRGSVRKLMPALRA